MPRLFKALGAVLCLIFALSFAAPNAVADQFVYTYTITFEPDLFGATFTTGPMDAVTAPTTVLAADLASFSLTGSLYQGHTLASLTLDAFGLGDQTWQYVGGGGEAFPDIYALSDYSTPGTYTSIITSTLTVTNVTATPEPSSLTLMLSGVGLVLAMRKRWSSGLQQAS